MNARKKRFLIIVLILVVFVIGIVIFIANKGGNKANNGTYILVDGEKINLNELDSKSVTKYYGKIITNLGERDYALYYVDYDGKFGEKGSVYLKAIEGRSINIHRLPNSQNMDALKIMKQLNPSWNKERGNTQIDKLQSNEITTLFFYDPTVCNQITNQFGEKYGKEYVNYSIAAPSAELFAQSFNDCGNLTDDNEIELKWTNTETETKKTNNNEWISGYTFFESKAENPYYISENGLRQITSKQKDSLTNEQRTMLFEKCSMQWLSSPMASNFNYSVCAVNESGEISGVAAIAVACPVVSLKNGVDLTK